MSYNRGPGVQHWHSISTYTDGLLAPQAGASTQVWPSANLAIYTPVIVRTTVIVKQLWHAQAPTATGNYDIGLYNAAGVALLRKGSTAKTTANGEVVWDCTDTTIGPGIYYIAFASDSGTDDFPAWSPAAPMAAATGILSEASGFALPATATFAVPQTLAFVPIVGMFLDTRVT